METEQEEPVKEEPPKKEEPKKEEPKKEEAPQETVFDFFFKKKNVSWLFIFNFFFWLGNIWRCIEKKTSFRWKRIGVFLFLFFFLVNLIRIIKLSQTNLILIFRTQCYKKKDFTKALEHYNKAFELDPTNISYLTNTSGNFFFFFLKKKLKCNSRFNK